METTTYHLRFAGTTEGEGNRLAAELRESLLDAHKSISAERTRDDHDSQDFGATLVLVLGTPAVVAAAAGIKAFLSRANASGLEVRTPQGTLIASNLESKDVSEIVRALTAGSRHG